MKMVYSEEEDVLHLAISDGPEKRSIKLGPNIPAELNDDGELVGIKILNTRGLILDSFVESLQAKMLS